MTPAATAATRVASASRLPPCARVRRNAGKLRGLSGRQLGFGEDVDGDGRLVVGAVDLAFRPVFGDRSFDDAGAAAVTAGGQRVVQDRPADLPDQVDGSV